MQALRTLLILSHRYIGIPLSFFFVLWFASAFVMIYAGGMPRITPEMRIEGAGSLNFSEITVSPAQAVAVAGFSPSSAKIRSVLGRPVYEFQESDSGSTFVFADNGEILNYLDEDQARQIASDFLDIPQQEFSFVGLMNEADQWTLTQRRDLPLYKFTADDGLGTEVYVSPVNANVSVYTTSQSRLLAWLGTIPHWLYFTSLRLDQPLWYDIVVWSSGIGCIMAIMGLCLGVTQFQKIRPFKLARAIPYRGLMRWHYILGVVFGFVTLTWVFSGLLSMEPFAWTRASGLDVDRHVYMEGELDMTAFPELNGQNWNGLVDGEIKEVEFSWIQGQPYYLVNYGSEQSLDMVKRDRLHQPYNIIGQAESNNVLIDALSFTLKEGFDIEILVSKLRAAASQASVVDYEVLMEYDDYYYSRNNQIPLPVLRIKFDDPQQSWIYVDPLQSQLLTTVPRWGRVERWLYNGLHSLDFAFWYHRRPLWDVGVIILLMGGLLSSCSGLYFALRRLKYDVQYLVNRCQTKFKLVSE